jgi:hypothetical protein
VAGHLADVHAEVVAVRRALSINPPLDLAHESPHGLLLLGIRARKSG